MAFRTQEHPMNRKLNKVINGILSITVAAMYMNNLTAHPVGEDDHPDPEHAVMLAEIKLGTNGDTGVIRELTGPTETKVLPLSNHWESLSWAESFLLWRGDRCVHVFSPSSRVA